MNIENQACGPKQYNKDPTMKNFYVTIQTNETNSTDILACARSKSSQTTQVVYCWQCSRFNPVLTQTSKSGVLQTYRSGVLLLQNILKSKAAFVREFRRFIIDIDD
jgi:hypothetical protein